MTDLERVIDVCVRTDLGLRDEAVLLSAIADLSDVLYDGDRARVGDGSLSRETRKSVEAVVVDLRIVLRSIKAMIEKLSGGGT